MKKIFLVLGMHRSATSLTAGLLFSYGLYGGEEKNLLEANENNQRGYFENKNIILLDETILCGYGIYSWECITEKINLVRETHYKNEIRNIIKYLCIGSKKEQNIFIKDPRMCLTEPVWRKELQENGLEENIIIVFRHPFEVARSLKIRNNMNFSYALKLWFYYNLSILDCIAGRDVPVLVLNHEDYFVFRTKQINKLKKFIEYEKGNDIDESFIDNSLRHNFVNDIHEDINIELKDMIFKLYEYLLNLAKNDVVVIKEDLIVYEKYLEKMASTLYESGGEDTFNLKSKNIAGREKKMWILYQIQNKRDIIVMKLINYFNKKGIKEIYLYGNGSITKELITILQDVCIIIKRIFDINQSDYIINLQNVESGIYILNTVINYDDSIYKFLSEYFNEKFILDIYILFNEVIFKNSTK